MAIDHRRLGLPGAGGGKPLCIPYLRFDSDGNPVAVSLPEMQYGDTDDSSGNLDLRRGPYSFGVHVYCPDASLLAGDPPEAGRIVQRAFFTDALSPAVTDPGDGLGERKWHIPVTSSGDWSGASLLSMIGAVLQHLDEFDFNEDTVIDQSDFDDNESGIVQSPAYPISAILHNVNTIAEYPDLLRPPTGEWISIIITVEAYGGPPVVGYRFTVRWRSESLTMRKASLDRAIGTLLFDPQDTNHPCDWVLTLGGRSLLAGIATLDGLTQSMFIAKVAITDEQFADLWTAATWRAPMDILGSDLVCLISGDDWVASGGQIATASNLNYFDGDGYKIAITDAEVTATREPTHADPRDFGNYWVDAPADTGWLAAGSVSKTATGDVTILPTAGILLNDEGFATGVGGAGGQSAPGIVSDTFTYEGWDVSEIPDGYIVVGYQIRARCSGRPSLGGNDTSAGVGNLAARYGSSSDEYTDDLPTRNASGDGPDPEPSITYLEASNLAVTLTKAEAAAFLVDWQAELDEAVTNWGITLNSVEIRFRYQAPAPASGEGGGAKRSRCRSRARASALPG